MTTALAAQTKRKGRITAGTKPNRQRRPKRTRRGCPLQFVTVPMEDNAFEPAEADVQRGAPAGTRSRTPGRCFTNLTIDDTRNEDMRGEA